VNFYNELDRFSDRTALITEDIGAISYKNLLAVADKRLDVSLKPKDKLNKRGNRHKL
jgi:hypothetical protein